MESSSYERIRAANIERNKAMHEKLGLATAASSLTAPTTPQRRPRPAAKRASPPASRRSARTHATDEAKPPTSKALRSGRLLVDENSKPSLRWLDLYDAGWCELAPPARPPARPVRPAA